MDNNVIVIAFILLVVVGIIFAIRRSAQSAPETVEKKATPPEDSEPKKTEIKSSVLDDRMEVDAPVEIHDGMSLAEIKKAKAARVKSKGRRETAVEATAKAKDEHSEAAESEVVESEATDEEEVSDVEEIPAIEKPQEDELADLSTGWEEMLDEDDGEPKVDIEAEEAPDVDADPPEEEAAPEESEVEQQEIEIHAGLDTSSEVATTSLADGLKKTRTGFIQRLGKFFKGETLDENLVEEVEEVLYTADIGTSAASQIMDAIQDHLSGDEDPEVVWSFVRNYIETLLKRREAEINLDSETPFVILVVGVNGVGKTTTIGKIASKYKKQGKSVLLVAGDTFRAAAVEQLEVWGERTGVPVHTGAEKADPASVVFAGIEKAKKDGVDVVICDTAGRLHTKQPLIDELGKIGRSAQKVIDNAPHEVILVLDANTGQNAIQQAKVFDEAVDITGIVLTKLDGTAKGGVILGICEDLDAPIRYIGIGEGVADLRPFKADEFTEALFL